MAFQILKQLHNHCIIYITTGLQALEINGHVRLTGKGFSCISTGIKGFIDTVIT